MIRLLLRMVGGHSEIPGLDHPKNFLYWVLLRNPCRERRERGPPPDLDSNSNMLICSERPWWARYLTWLGSPSLVPQGRRQLPEGWGRDLMRSRPACNAPHLKSSHWPRSSRAGGGGFLSPSHLKAAQQDTRERAGLSKGWRRGWWEEVFLSVLVH